MESYAVRITHPKETVKHILAVWSTRCEKIVAIEHTDTPKVHSHLLIINCSIEKKQLRNIAANCGVNVKGNESMSFKAYDANERYLVYMSKGQFDPYYLQQFTAEQCLSAKALWVPDQKKASLQARQYNRFESSIDLNSDDFKKYVTKCLEVPTYNFNMAFEYIRTKGSAFSFAECDRIASHKYINMYKMVVNTYCMRHNIPIDTKWKGNAHI